MTIKNALLSVSDKTDLTLLAQGLVSRGIQLFASGGTAQALRDANIHVQSISALTNAPEMLGGRVKTLHPGVHGGILADRRNAEHLADLVANNIQTLDLVVCNLYPFEETRKTTNDRATLIEKIDIGGPTMVRAAAKNCEGGVTVVVDPADYTEVLNAMAEEGSVNIALRRKLAAKAFKRIAAYDIAIADWICNLDDDAVQGFPVHLDTAERSEILRYGENPEQRAFVYRASNEGGVANGAVLQGKAVSYNNYLDLDAAQRCATAFDAPACAVIKHTNPCGLAQAETLPEAFARALESDPVSAFGGILGFNREVDANTAEAIRVSKLFVECIVAPGFSDEARALFAPRENLRLMQAIAPQPNSDFHGHRIGGGWLVQTRDNGPQSTEHWKTVTEAQLQPGFADELLFAMRAAWLLKSNAIAIARHGQLLGTGMGQTNRVDAAKQAIERAGDKARGAFLASDAFFPFADCVALARDAGILAIVQPGGSKRDQESIDVCNAAGIAMVFTGQRHFRH